MYYSELFDSMDHLSGEDSLPQAEDRRALPLFPAYLGNSAGTWLDSNDTGAPININVDLELRLGPIPSIEDNN